MQYFCTARLAMVFMAVVLAGCEGLSPIAERVSAAPAEAADPADPARSEVTPVSGAPARGAELGKFRFTMYYVAVETEKKRGEEPVSDEETAFVSGAPDALSGRPDKVTLYDKGCKPIAEVDPAFAKQLDIQGTGKLADGRVLNTSGLCKCPNSPCFMEIKATWAIGANGRLAPFRSVAIDTRLIELGSLLYIPELAGKRMPGKAPWGGYVHDGCVVADDRGGGIRGKELDLFVAKKGYSTALYHRTRLKQVTVFDGTGWCERRDGRIRKVAGAI